MSHESAFQRAARRRQDFTTKSGAEALKERIANYWKTQNLAPRLRLEHEPLCAKMLTPRTDVRSDMVDGWPRRQRGGA